MSHRCNTDVFPAAVRRRNAVFLMGLLAVSSLGGIPHASAQTPSDGSSPAAPPAAAAVKPLPPLPRFRLEETRADRLPYTTWKTHLGPAAEAMVTASVTTLNRKTGETTTKKGVGLVIRCDGFVLLPASLFPVSLFPPPGVPSVDRRQAADQVQEILLRTTSGTQKSGGSDENTVVPASFPATLTRYTSQSVPYVLVKAQNVHLRAAPLLHPRNVTAASGLVEVVFPKQESDTTAPLTLQRLKARVVPQGGGVFGLTLENGNAVSAASLSIPPGAVVVDTESKMALGIIAPPLSSARTPLSGAAIAFASFERFHDITNSVALVPAPDDRLNTAALAARPPGSLQEGMVWIPGGALTVHPDANPELEGASVACAPGFWIDQNEVTLGQYKAFMKATGYRPQSGVGLVDAKEGEAGGAPGDDAHADSLPVHGVSVVDAEAYAAWRGSRLATPLEWEWASRGAGMLSVKPMPPPGVERMFMPPLRVPEVAKGRVDGRPRTFLELTKLYRLDETVVVPGTPWTTIYERALAEVELNTRLCMLLIAFMEAKCWSFYKELTGDPNLFSNYSRLHAYARVPEFKQLIDSTSPSRNVLDPSYVTAFERIGAFVPRTVRDTYAPIFYIDDTCLRPNALKTARRLVTDIFEPLAIAPAGTHAYDRSMFDIRGTQTNVPEWLQENRASRADNRAFKLLPPLFDPVKQPEWEDIFDAEITRRVAEYNVALNHGERFSVPAVLSRMVFIAGTTPADFNKFGVTNTIVPPSDLGTGRRYIDFPNPGQILTAAIRLNRQATAQNVAQYPTRLLPFVRLGHPEDAPDLGTGFRCAR